MPKEFAIGETIRTFKDGWHIKHEYGNTARLIDAKGDHRFLMIITFHRGSSYFGSIIWRILSPYARSRFLHKFSIGLTAACTVIYSAVFYLLTDARHQFVAFTFYLVVLAFCTSLMMFFHSRYNAEKTEIYLRKLTASLTTTSTLSTGITNTFKTMGQSLTWSTSNTTAYLMHNPITNQMYPIEHIKDGMPILASRYVGLVHQNDRFRFRSVIREHYLFDIDAMATCNKVSSHKVPDLACTCGFYAVPLGLIKDHAYAGFKALVELSGTVIEHETGYRAQHQRIVEVQIRDCVCRKPATHIVFSPDDQYDGGYIRALLPQCEEHNYTGSLSSWHCFSIEEISEKLDVPFVRHIE